MTTRVGREYQWSAETVVDRCRLLTRCADIDPLGNLNGQGRPVGATNYFSLKTTGPTAGSVTPRPPPRSSSVSRKESRVVIIFGRALMHASMSFHSGAITGLNNVGMDQARPSCLDFLVSIQKLLIAPRPHSKTHNIESGHRPFSHMRMPGYSRPIEF